MTSARTDCFAYRPGQRSPRKKAECAALNELYCIDEECRFCKRKKREKQGNDGIIS